MSTDNPKTTKTELLDELEIIRSFLSEEEIQELISQKRLEIPVLIEQVTVAAEDPNDIDFGQPRRNGNASQNAVSHINGNSIVNGQQQFLNSQMNGQHRNGHQRNSFGVNDSTPITNGVGSNGAGVKGSDVKGLGASEPGINRSGTNGSGNNGSSGINGAGINGAGINGAGINSSAINGLVTKKTTVSRPELNKQDTKGSNQKLSDWQSKPSIINTHTKLNGLPKEAANSHFADAENFSFFKKKRPNGNTFTPKNTTPINSPVQDTDHWADKNRDENTTVYLKGKTVDTNTVTNAFYKEVFDHVVPPILLSSSKDRYPQATGENSTIYNQNTYPEETITKMEDNPFKPAGTFKSSSGQKAPFERNTAAERPEPNHADLKSEKTIPVLPAVGENPFLPNHIRERLQRGSSAILDELMQVGDSLNRDKTQFYYSSQSFRKNSPARPNSDSPSSSQNSDRNELLIDELIAEFLPKIEAALRQRLRRNLAKKYSTKETDSEPLA